MERQQIIIIIIAILVTAGIIVVAILARRKKDKNGGSNSNTKMVRSRLNAGAGATCTSTSCPPGYTCDTVSGNCEPTVAGFSVLPLTFVLPTAPYIVPGIGTIPTTNMLQVLDPPTVPVMITGNTSYVTFQLYATNPVGFNNTMYIFMNAPGKTTNFANVTDAWGSLTYQGSSASKGFPVNGGGGEVLRYISVVAVTGTSMILFIINSSGDYTINSYIGFNGWVSYNL